MCLFLTIFRYVSISDDAAGGSQVLFFFEGMLVCGRTVSKEVFQSIKAI